MMLHISAPRSRQAALAFATAILIGLFTSVAFAAAPMQKAQSGYLHTMLGKFEVTAISDGTIDLPMEKLLAEPIEDSKKALNRAFLDDPTETSVNAFLVNTGDK